MCSKPLLTKFGIHHLKDFCNGYIAQCMIWTTGHCLVSWLVPREVEDLEKFQGGWYSFYETQFRKVCRNHRIYLFFMNLLVFQLDKHSCWPPIHLASREMNVHIDRKKNFMTPYPIAIFGCNSTPFTKSCLFRHSWKRRRCICFICIVADTISQWDVNT